MPRSSVKAHVYEISSMWETINSSVSSLQAYHVGVEVYGWEYTFQFIFDDPEGTGVVICKPTQAMNYIFKESMDLGPTPYSEDQIQAIIEKLASQWLSKNYHLTRRNCVDFSRVLTAELKVRELPAWVSSAADASKEGGVLSWIVERGWQGVQWYYGVQSQPSTDQDVRKFSC